MPRLHEHDGLDSRLVGQPAAGRAAYLGLGPEQQCHGERRRKAVKSSATTAFASDRKAGPKLRVAARDQTDDIQAEWTV